MTPEEMSRIDFEKGGGLVPAIVQDADTQQVLMLAYMDRAALEETIASGEATFFSRSRGGRWRKGETSGNRLKVRDVRADCDGDTLLVSVTPSGLACHLGTATCFGDVAAAGVGILPALERTIARRAGEAGSPGDTMVQPQFAFAAWAIAAKAAGANVISAPEENYTISVDALLDAVDARTRVMFVANPGNPTGACIPFADIERLHAGLPEHVILVLDAAYSEFAEDMPGYEDELRLACSALNVVLTRTFSKLHGLAALRVGWGYAAAQIVDALNRIRLPFNVSTAGQAAAIAAIEDDVFVSNSLALVREGRRRLTDMLGRAGLSTLPSHANFITALAPEGPAKAQALEQSLAEQGILVRGLTNYGMADGLRVTIGGADELEALQHALAASTGARRT